jgi:hypothetical protein
MQDTEMLVINGRVSRMVSPQYRPSGGLVNRRSAAEPWDVGRESRGHPTLCFSWKILPVPHLGERAGGGFRP